MAASSRTNAFRAAYVSLIAPAVVYFIYDFFYVDAHVDTQQVLKWVIVAVDGIGFLAGSSVLFTFVGHRSVTPVLLAICGSGVCAFLFASIVMPILR